LVSQREKFAALFATRSVEHRTSRKSGKIVSNWEVNSDSAVTLMVGTFAALAVDPKLSHAEALPKSMLAMSDQHPEQADPKYWALFVVVGGTR
jgi:CHAT domain-containing protein